MYIPLTLRASPDAVVPRTDASIIDSLVARTATESANRRTGIIIGVVLGLFLVAACVFLFTYRNSVRCTRKRKRHHHHRRHKSTSSKSSKSSKSSDGGAPPPPPA